MSRRVLIAVMAAVHLLCLAPVIWLVRFCTSAGIFLNPNPVKFIIHFTGDWAIYMLLASVALSLLGRLTARAPWVIQFYPLPGLYAFFWATLHAVIYFCIYSGYDFIGAFAGFHTGHPGALADEWSAVFPGVFEDFRKRPFIDVGLFAWVILLAGALTSPGFLRRALHIKKWQPLYRLTYAAAIAAVIHFWWFVISSAPTFGGRCMDVFRTGAMSNFAAKEQRSQHPHR
jgi:sulfoxide reductase heme-binding subunit YedZ